MSNTELWDSVCKTDPKHTKPAKIGGMRITAIDPQYQRRNATEMFGPYGIEWGILAGSEHYAFKEFGTTTLLMYQATMFYKYQEKEGQFPIVSTIKAAYQTTGDKGYLKVDDDCLKKAQTDALTKGLSFLGFNADVFMGLFDDSKYVERRKKEESNPRLLGIEAAKERHKDTILAVKAALASEEWDSAAEAWCELTDEEMDSLRVSHTDGGPFNPQESAIFKNNNEFFAARKQYKENK